MSLPLQSDSSNVEWTRPDNPDYLAFLLTDLHDHDLNTRRLPEIPQTPERQQAVLDSLARILVTRSKEQVVAIALETAKDDQPATFFIAQNDKTVPSEVVDHLDLILDHLLQVHQIYESTGMNPDSEEDKRLALLEDLGECRALFSCREKMQRRLTKKDRNECFLEMVQAVSKGVPSDVKDAAARLEAILLRFTDADRQSLLAIGEAIKDIRELLKTAFEGDELPSKGDRQIIAQIRDRCDVVRRHCHQGLRAESTLLWAICDEYLEGTSGKTILAY